MQAIVRSVGGRVAAARTAAGLFLLAGILAVAGSAVPSSRVRDLMVIAIADVMIAGAACVVPWDRLHPRATVVLAVAGLVVLGFSTWAFGGVATGTGPFFVLLFAWVGMHHPPSTAVLLTPLTAAAYIAPLVATGQPPAVTGSAVVFVPVTTAVAIVIARRVRQLDEARREVESAERWRAALMETLAHDVRTPLTAVQAALELLGDDTELSGADRQRLAGVALRQTGRITRLAGGLLDVGRVEGGALRLERRVVPLRAAVERSASFVPHCAVRVEVDEAATVHADPERLEQMLVNLIGNAARHGTPPIVVTSDNGPAGTRIVVRDHGHGVLEQARGTLFTRFAAQTAGSVGLGLWIVRELARAHGGDVTYEPATPGSRFIITLPSR